MKITHIDQVKFAIQARSHTVICDQPAENGGGDAGMTPPEFLVGVAGFLRCFLCRAVPEDPNLAESGVEVSVTAEKLKSPHGWATSTFRSRARFR